MFTWALYNCIIQWEVEEIEGSVSEDSNNRVCTYTIIVETGWKWGASTCSPVYFTIYGNDGDTGIRRLGSKVNVLIVNILA